MFWSANGGTIDSIRTYVLMQTNGTSTASKLIAWGQISSAEISVTDTNRLTIQWAANGVFTLT